MSPAEKRSLRICWYGLSLPWPLTNDKFGLPYFLAANDDGTYVRKAAPQRRVVRRS